MPGGLERDQRGSTCSVSARATFSQSKTQGRVRRPLDHHLLEPHLVLFVYPRGICSFLLPITSAQTNRSASRTPRRFSSRRSALEQMLEQVQIADLYMVPPVSRRATRRKA